MMVFLRRSSRNLDFSVAAELEWTVSRLDDDVFKLDEEPAFEEDVKKRSSDDLLFLTFMLLLLEAVSADTDERTSFSIRVKLIFAFSVAISMVW